jgi:hypothetical protein
MLQTKEGSYEIIWPWSLLLQHGLNNTLNFLFIEREVQVTELL